MKKDASKREKDRIRRAAGHLYAATRPIRVLRTIGWEPEVKEAFFAAGAKELPKVAYPPFDAAPVRERLADARRLIVSDSRIDGWLTRHADAIDESAQMLAAAGTAAFFEHSRRLYGEPTKPLLLFPHTPLDLAKSVAKVIDQLGRVDIDIGARSRHSSAHVARMLRTAVGEHFGDAAPKVQIVDRLSANALATAKLIRIRRGATFTDLDAAQLLHHEAYIHVATSLNGKAQTDLPILAAGHPGTTLTQEGLAVYAEIVSGAMELDRMKRLAIRVFGIQMAIEGADFLDVYRRLLELTGDPDQAFESARRIYRGGVITGGAPFTKDVVYLFGLLRMSNFVRASFAAGRADVIRLLFCGKLDLADLPALCELNAMGLCRPTLFAPPWVRDPRALLASLTYTTFMGSMDMESLIAAAKRILADVPLVERQG